jgi:hypothetical protein
VLGLVLVALLIFEAPTFIKLFRSKSSAPPVTPVVTTPAQTSTAAKQLAAIRRAPAVDPFSVHVPPLADPGVRVVPVPPGSRDPFAAPTVASQSTASTVVPLPQQIVIGTPGANRTASHGWIVILASIPTGAGRQSATTFAASAKQNGIDPIGVLNSSNRRPLRGGYWVVYTGPFKTLTQVSAQAAMVHSHGYATAYIRELLVYS